MSSLEQEIRGYFSAHRIEFDYGSRSFQDEPFGQGGIERRPEHWLRDFQQTR